ncbi:hypothetical protein [Paraburkholderia sp. 32]|uniref:hypothetical protein n=1 Tax=Paraburkholderia sp. 32 TaxID=2991057 RepID=UPI003D1D68AB
MEAKAIAAVLEEMMWLTAQTVCRRQTLGATNLLAVAVHPENEPGRAGGRGAYGCPGDCGSARLLHPMKGQQKEKRMLRITIELLPGGQEEGKRVIATADIARASDGPTGALGDYRVALSDAILGEVGEPTVVRRYPRWASSVWDLVARCLATALNQGREALPPRPARPEVTVRTNDAGYRYVRLDEIPEPTRTFFDRKLAGSGIPDHGCAFAHDWFDFLNGHR